MSGRLRVREIDDDEGQRLVRIVRRQRAGGDLAPRADAAAVTPYLLIPDQGTFCIVAVRVNPGGMVAFSSAIFAGVGGRNP